MKNLLIIGGATGTGKSKLAVMCAKSLGGEVISADSMQIYKKMDIGTAKVTIDEMQGVPHHMINICEPGESYTVCNYRETVIPIIKDIYSRGKLPIIAGGTGLYINSIIYDMSFSGNNDSELRCALYAELDSFGKEYMHGKLRELCPEISSKLHVNDTKRVIRAIEKALTGGKVEDDIHKILYPYKMFVLDIGRDLLYRRLNARVDLMLKGGLIGEVDSLLKSGQVSYTSQSMQAIAYKEWANVMVGMDSNTVIELIKKNTRNYAKRQITWFKQYKDALWLNALAPEQALEIICSYYKE